jgi:uncharacterized protein (TIGR03083 family)
VTEQVLQLIEQEWSVIDELCSELMPKEWNTLTDCPGWTVKDQLAHMCALESILLGEKPAPPLAQNPSHVRNEMGAVNEAGIEARRHLSPEEILAEFLEVTTARLKVLGDVEDWGAETQGVLGRAPMREVIAVRLLDCFYHEQDIRRATKHPGHMEGDVARFLFERMKGATPMIVAKRAQAPDGSSVAFEVNGLKWLVQVSGRRGVLAEGAPPQPAELIKTDLETFFMLTGGRILSEAARKQKRLTIKGDLAQRVAEHMNVLP